MRDGGGGWVANLADWVAASRPRHCGFFPYYVPRCGGVALTEALAVELADDRILVNVVAPGQIALPDDFDEASRAVVEHVTALGRYGEMRHCLKRCRHLSRLTLCPAERFG